MGRGQWRALIESEQVFHRALDCTPIPLTKNANALKDQAVVERE